MLSWRERRRRVAEVPAHTCSLARARARAWALARAQARAHHTQRAAMPELEACLSHMSTLTVTVSILFMTPTTVYLGTLKPRLRSTRAARGREKQGFG